MQVETIVLTVRVEQVCDKCKEGVMRPSGMALMSSPAKYPHFCTVCGAHENFNKTYPAIEYRDA
jgi:hypothetical protein